MSRLFANTSTPDAGPDVVTFSAGGLATLHTGAYTIAYLIKPISCRGGLHDARDSGNSRRHGVNPFDNNLFVNTQVDGFQNFDISTLFGFWGIVGFSKPNGSAAHKKHVWSSFDNSWIHGTITGQGNVSNGTGVVDTFKVGSFDGSQQLEGRLAVAGYWSRELTDLEFQGLATANALSAWVNLTPAVLHDYHGPVATPIVDIMGSGADQISIAGTLADADDPPGFNYSLSGGSAYRGGQFLPFF